MVVQHNLQAANANRMLNITTNAQSVSTEKLSSGYRINRAADDAAGLSISEKMRKQIRGLTQASSNAQDGISAVQTAEGALTEVHDMLQRMNELAVQAANGTNSESDRQSIQDEVRQLTTEIDRVSETTKFNETYLLKGNGKTSTVQVTAKDAGIEGSLVGAGTGLATFTMTALKEGETITIGSKGYTIGTTIENVKAAVANANIGDTITINNTAYTVVDDGNSDETENKYSATEISQMISDGNTVVVGTHTYVAMKDNSVSISDGTDTVTADSLASAISAAAATDASTVTIDGTTYKYSDGTDATNYPNGAGWYDTAGTPATDSPIETSAIQSMVTAAFSGLGNGDSVDIAVMDAAGGNTTATTYTATGVGNGIGDNDASIISADKAYELIANELTKASSVGTDAGNGATAVLKEGSGAYSDTVTQVSFEITEGSVEVTQGLQFTLHVGADAKENNKIATTISTMDAAGLGIKGLNLVDNSGAAATYAIDAIEEAIKKVSSQRSTLGAIQNRLDHTINNLDNVVENTTSAESQIRDTDMATEMVNYSKTNILAQAGQAMLAQAKNSNQGVLALLQ